MKTYLVLTVMDINKTAICVQLSYWILDTDLFSSVSRTMLSFFATVFFMNFIYRNY